MSDTQNHLARPCRSCGKTGLELILSLGNTPLANALPTADKLHETEATYPLDLALCPHCALVQITETVAPEELFGDYLYFSSFSDTMLRSANALVERLVSERKLNSESLAAEVASNDGYLLQYYLEKGVPVLGIEPAANIASVARERGVETLCEFFGADVARRLKDENRRADVIHSNNVLAHVPDLNGFVQGLRLVLKDEGIAVIEAPYVKDMIDGVEFDTIYHEHLCYFSLTALDALFRRQDMVIYDVERIPIHGGSLRVFAAPSQAANARQGERVRALLREEAAWGVDTMDFYRDFARRVEELKSSLRALLVDLKRDGKRVAAYGAAAKGSTLLNYFGIGTDVLDFVVDRSTYKQGRFMPGVHLPIHGPDALLQEKPDYVLLLAWNFSDEIIEQQKEYRGGGGRFIVPIPELKVV